MTFEERDQYIVELIANENERYVKHIETLYEESEDKKNGQRSQGNLRNEYF